MLYKQNATTHSLYWRSWTMVWYQHSNNELKAGHKQIRWIYKCRVSKIQHNMKQPYISKYRFRLLLFTCPITFISLRHVNAIWHRKYRSTVFHAMACCPRIQKVCPKICGLMKWVSWDWLICVNPGANEMIIMHLKSKLQLCSNSPLKTLCCWNESLCDKI